MKRGQVRGQSQLRVMVLDGNRRANLISGNMRAQFDAAQRIGLHLDANLGSAGLHKHMGGIHYSRSLRRRR